MAISMQLDFSKATMDLARVNHFLHLEGLPLIPISEKSFNFMVGDRYTAVLVSEIRNLRKDINMNRLESEVVTSIPASNEVAK